MSLPILTLVLLTASPAPGTPALSLAVPAWSAVEVKPELAAFFSDHVASVLRSRGLQVVTASEMASLLSLERQRQLLGCRDDQASSCIAELANALGVSHLLLGNIARLDDTFRAHLKIVSSLDGHVLSEERVTASGQNALLEELEKAATRLADRLVPPPAARGTKRWWWLPTVTGGVLVAAGAGSLIGAQLTWVDLNQRLSTNKVVQEADRTSAQTGATLQTLGWVGVGVGAAALAAGLGLALFGSNDTLTTTAWLAPDGAGVALSGRLP